jgi:hypothetical protein
MSIVEIQSKLKAPKSQLNKFGGYKYRSCEDILEAVKPLLHEYGYHLIINDEVVAVGSRIYVMAVASVHEGDKVVAKASAFAREADTKKGMDEAQITGAASSYARKYALNGLFAIDDCKDADATNGRGHENGGYGISEEETYYSVDNIRKMAGDVGYDLTKLHTPLEKSNTEQRKKLFGILNKMADTPS